ncbi:MAG: rod shape-determining protein MreD [Microthrixaceae bacterium]
MVTESSVLIRWGVLLSGVFVVQLGFVNDLGIFGVHPDLLLLVAVCAGLVGGSSRGAAVGFVAGLLGDLMMPGSLGVTALCFTLVGFGVGAAEDSVIRSTRAISMAISAAASALGVLLYAGVSQLLGAHTMSDPQLWRVVGIVAALNGVLCLLALPLCRWAEGLGLRSGAYGS